MKVREVSDLVELRDDWNSLLEKNILGDNVFLTWEWLSNSLKHFGGERRPLVLCVEDKNEILAIAPLMLSKYKLPGFGSIRKIEFIGHRHSDYNNFIILKREKECITYVLDYLKEYIENWDWIELKEIPEHPNGFSSLETLLAAHQSGLMMRKRVCDICPYISLPTTPEDLLKGLSKNMRQNINKYSRKLKESHKVEFKKYDEAGYSVKQAMSLFLDLNERRWASKGMAGSFKSKEDTFRNFHMEVSKCFADKGWLGLYFLFADDEPVAVQYAFEYNSKMYYYLAGFDPKFSDYSIGNLLMMYLLENCIKKGFKEYDLMRGDEPYKLRWTKTYRKNFEARLVKRGISSRFYDYVTWSNITSTLAGKFKLCLKKSKAS
jgi:CelD/BcsL family acetyltransferase involved in cellulose biosynthesis